MYHEGNAYRVNFLFMSKNDAFNLITNSNIICVIMSFNPNKRFANNLDRINASA